MGVIVNWASDLQAGSWDCLKSMDGHKGGVNSLSVHPNGSVALSVGRCFAATALRIVQVLHLYDLKLCCNAAMFDQGID